MEDDETDASDSGSDDEQSSKSDAEETITLAPQQPTPGRSRGRPRGRGRGRGRPPRNPFHVRERGPPKGSRPRGNRKGVKRPRKPVEPSDEFKALKSQATVAYLDGDFASALELVEQAIMRNPEIFSAYALLSSIYQACGDDAKAVAALFQGAHTRPKDVETWNSVADTILEIGKDRTAALADAVYCYNRAIGADKQDIGSRRGRAELQLELGRYTQALKDYKHILRTLSTDLEALRGLAGCYCHCEQPQLAIPYYDAAISIYRAQNNAEGPLEFWSDLNIYAELHWISMDYADGLLKVKRAARWLLGRGEDNWWDEWIEDDREFDAEDLPRRVLLQNYERKSYDQMAYGLGLPLEIRVKLALFRLKLDLSPHTEALNHLAWLDPIITGDEALVIDYPDLMRDAGKALKEAGYFEQAIHFYAPLEGAGEDLDARYYLDLGECYRAQGVHDQAERCLRIAADLQEFDEEALEKLIEMFEFLGSAQEADQARSQLLSRKLKKVDKARALQRRQADQQAMDPEFPIVSMEEQYEEEDDDENFNVRMLAQPAILPGLDNSNSVPRPKQDGKKRPRYQNVANEDMRPIFESLALLEGSFSSNDHVNQLQWLDIAGVAVDHLQSYKAFWPSDRSIRPIAKRSQISTVENRLNPEAAPAQALQAEVPPDFCNVKMSEWLDFCLQYALRISRERSIHGHISKAYKLCDMIASCTVWRLDPENQFLIHLVWAMCAVQVKDYETLCMVARFFSKQYQFLTDSYRLYAALNRLCNLRNDWYQAGPSQKYVMRQIKALDLYFSPGVTDAGLQVLKERGSTSRSDPSCSSAAAKGPDVALLILYSHMLYASGSYAYGIHYIYRAHALEPDNPMVLLGLALGYTHHATKRQSENRHQLISCGISFLYRYYDIRKGSNNALEKQEAEYNVGRTFQFLNLLDLAVPHYERCLALDVEVKVLEADHERVQNFAREAAFALREIYAQSGLTIAALDIINKWLVL